MSPFPQTSFLVGTFFAASYSKTALVLPMKICKTRKNDTLENGRNFPLLPWLPKWPKTENLSWTFGWRSLCPILCVAHCSSYIHMYEETSPDTPDIQTGCSIHSCYFWPRPSRDTAVQGLSSFVVVVSDDCVPFSEMFSISSCIAFLYDTNLEKFILSSL